MRRQFHGIKKALLGTVLLGSFLITAFSRDFFLMTDSRIFKNDPFWQQVSFKKSESIKGLIFDLTTGKLPEAVVTKLPVIWWHSEEKYKSSDPLDLFSQSLLAYRELVFNFPFKTQNEIIFGPINSLDWRSTQQQGGTPTTVVSRLHEKGGLKQGYAGFELRYDADLQNNLNPPLLWRISKHPLFEKIQPLAEDEIFLPIEFWYHSSYNYTSIHFGFHDGDWESFLYLFKVTSKNNELKMTPVMLSVSAHGHTEWHCYSELNFNDQRIELFSALGTHATYTSPGIHWRLYPDRTERGEMWKTWLLTRYLPNETYYGFSGSWGRTSYIDFQNAPIPPGPDFKYLPRETNIDSAVKEFNDVAQSCRI